MALSRVAFAGTAGNINGAQSTASFTWNAGDLFLIIQGNEDGSIAPGTPTFGGGTFTSLVGPVGNTSSNCYGRAWSCTPAGSGSGTVTDPSILRDHVILVWQFRGQSGTGGTSTGITAALTVSNVNTGTNSWVCMGWFDFGAGAAGRTGTPTVTNEVADTLDSGKYSWWGGDWSGQSGTVSYGTTTSGGGLLTKVCVEVKEAAAGGAVRPYQGRRDTSQAIRRAAFY